MKKLFIFLGLFVTIGINAQKVIVDSIDFAGITASDTVFFPNIPRGYAGEMLSVEVDYTSLNGDSAYIKIGGSNRGNSFNNATNLFGSSDSLRLDTGLAEITNGSAIGIPAIATAQSTIMFVDDRNYWKHLGFKLIKGDATTGKVYFYIIKL